MIQQDCPACHRPIDISRLRDGMRARCPHCADTFRVRREGETDEGGRKPVAQESRSSAGGSRLEVPGFEQIEFISKGAMGAVYKARESDLGRRVALKVLDPELANKQGFVERFRREGKTLAAIKHPNVVRVHRMLEGTSRDRQTGANSQVHVIAMEFVDGLHLRDHVQKLSRVRPLVEDVELGLSLLLQISRGVAAIHDGAVVHRDLKPENIMIDRDSSTVKVTDFGLAYFLERDAADNEWDTRTKMTMGTLAYMPPEQQKDAKRVAPSGDVYSLGRLGYELLTGRQADGRFSKPSELNPRLHPDYDAIIERCLEQQPEDRYQHASELVVALEAVGENLSEESTEAEPVPALSPATPDPVWVTHPHRAVTEEEPALSPGRQVEPSAIEGTSKQRMGWLLAGNAAFALAVVAGFAFCSEEPAPKQDKGAVLLLGEAGEAISSIYPVAGGAGLYQARGGLWFSDGPLVVQEAHTDQGALLQPGPAQVQQESLAAGDLSLERRIDWGPGEGDVQRQKHSPGGFKRLIGVGFQDEAGASWVQIDEEHRCVLVDKGKASDCTLEGKQTVEPPARLRLEQAGDRLRVVIDSSREVRELLEAPVGPARALLICQNQRCTFDPRRK